jgi:hypothetical protein
MATLTRAELHRYQEAFARHSAEPRLPVPAKRLTGTAAGAVALPRFLDLRPFPGRNRSERVVGWLLAHVPRAASWSRESLDQLAARIAATSDVIE